jgi:leucyl/phenylalanyl-tRNA--protein transferase
MTRITWLTPQDPPDRFPPVGQALEDPAGLLAGGGDLSPDRLLAAYRRGIFPWFSEGQPVLWWSPDPREVLFPAQFRLSRSLAKTLRGGRLTTTEDRAFEAVIDGCAAPRPGAQGTWITPDMREAYVRLHQRGIAHSIETWEAGQLVGGLYGVAVGRVFCGESMFSRRPDASKVAMAALVAAAPRQGIALIDCQMPSGHLRSLGSRPLPRERFLEYLPHPP